MRLPTQQGDTEVGIFDRDSLNGRSSRPAARAGASKPQAPHRGVVSDTAERTLVMYTGKLVEPLLPQGRGSHSRFIGQSS